jgi:hypothetical protein
VRYRHPPSIFLEVIKREPGISSVQITFDEDLAPELHAMPPAVFALPSSTASIVQWRLPLVSS